MNFLKNQSAMIVDVRTRRQFNMDRLRGSKNIPLDEIADRIMNFKK